MSVRSIHIVDVKQEAEERESVFDSSTIDLDQFGNMSVTGASSIGSIQNDQNLMNYPNSEYKMASDEKTPKKEEKAVVLRNTGKIGVQNRRRRLFSVRDSSQNRYFSGSGVMSSNTNNQWSPVTTELIIEPIQPQTPNNILVKTQTSATYEPNIIDLSDDEENNNHNEVRQQEQDFQQPQQAPSPLVQITPSPLAQIPPALLAALHDSVQQSVNVLNNTVDNSVYCNFCNQRYCNRNSFKKHTKTAKHQNNFQIAQQLFNSNNQ